MTFAAAAGVSHQTVSRLLRGFTGIRPETRARVETAIAELQYRPNPAVRSLKNGRTHRIGALTHDLTEVGPSKTIDGASHGADDAGYLLDVVSIDPRDPHAIEQAIQILRQQELAGVMVFVDPTRSQRQSSPPDSRFRSWSMRSSRRRSTRLRRRRTGGALKCWSNTSSG